MTPTHQVKLTVALLTYNRRASFLPDAVAAISRQTYSDFEFLILDNGSTDHTSDFILSLGDSRIRYVRNPVGSLAEFNGISAFHIATGRRVVVTHDDDIMEESMLSELMALMDANPDVKLAWTNVRKIDENGSELEPDAQFSGEARIFSPGAYIENFLTERIWPMPSAVMSETKLFPPYYINRYYYRKTNRRHGTGDSLAAGIWDIDFPARINMKHSVAFLDVPLLRYRIHANQESKAVDLSAPSVYLYTALRRHARQVRGRTIDDGLFESHILKHKLQQTLCGYQASSLSSNLRDTLRSLYRKAFVSGRRSPAALATALPLYLAAKLGLDPMRDSDDRVMLPFPADGSAAVKAFHGWAVAADESRSVFSALPAGTRLVLFGSALVAALLIMDARRHGISVVACIDSNVHRQGNELLGIPIHPPAWLRNHRQAFDMVVLTSEKDQENVLIRALEGALGGSVPGMSWKELAIGISDQCGTLSISAGEP